MTNTIHTPPTEPIIIPTAYQPRPAPAALWLRANSIYLTIGITSALAAATTELPRFESILTGIALCNTALWLLRKLGGRP